jgi:hypothetical protein
VRVLLAGLLTLAAIAGVVGLVVRHRSHRAPVEAATSPSCEPAKLNVSQALAGARVTVSPGPDTSDASAVTQISMLGVPVGELSAVTVRGSRSGTHQGRLLAYSQGDGASFLPSRRFAEGELVSVRADLRTDGTSTPFSWSFRVAVRDRKESGSTAAATLAEAGPAATREAAARHAAQVREAKARQAKAGEAKARETQAAGAQNHTQAAPKPASHGTPASADPSRRHQSFHSRPDLRPAAVTVSKQDRTATGELFLAPYSGKGQYGPMILDEHGGLIWFDRIPAGARAADFRVQRYEGQPVLTWWQDPLVANGSRKAGMVIANSAYERIAVARAGNGYQADLHEFQISPRGTALITVYDAIDCDTHTVGGPRDGAVADTLLQQIDLRTGLVMYEWHSLDHVPLASSYATATSTSRAEPFDYFHINSIDVGHEGDLLVDARNTWAAYDVDAKTGQVRWELGGKHSSFKLGPGTVTAWQHDARWQPNGAITFFDNGADPQIHPQSRAIEVALNRSSMTATMTRREEHRNSLVAGSQGNVQALADGDWMIGWGEAGYSSEVDASGRVLFNAHLPPSWESYRTYVLPWSGRPTQPPAVAVAPAKGTDGAATVYASWNGATALASWQVLAGASPTSLAPVADAARAGFETAIALPAPAAPYVAVRALDASGAVLGVSATVSSSASG